MKYLTVQNKVSICFSRIAYQDEHCSQERMPSSTSKSNNYGVPRSHVFNHSKIKLKPIFGFIFDSRAQSQINESINYIKGLIRQNPVTN